MNRYNAAGACSYPTTTIVASDSLTSYLAPTYVKTFPKVDGWGNPWVLTADQQFGPPSTATAAQQYAIVSKGKDGTAESTVVCGNTTNFDCDIVYSNGSFLQYPEGVQQN